MLSAAVISQISTSTTAHNPVVVSGGGFDPAAFLQQWLPLVFMGILVAAVIGLVRMAPKTRPDEIKPGETPAIAWGDIAGVDEAKEELREIVDYLRDPTKFHSVGAKAPRGILLHGPPGTGKTLLAKAVAYESGAAFYAQSASAFVEMVIGLGASRIRRLFRSARKHAPAIVFIDELDAVGGVRGTENTGERDQTLNQLLVELDGFNDAGDVVVIAASNLLDKLDPALLRPGRFDRQIFITPPDVEGREQILRVHSRGKPVDPEIDYTTLARQTAGLTGADLANICNEAAINAARHSSTVITIGDFDYALERVMAGMQSRRTLTEHERRVVAYHEGGHALCAELLPSVDPVHRISIVPRGNALGYTMNLPEEDRYLKTREELIEMMTMVLGGRAAEQSVFGSITTGAADDLHRVADIANSMIHDFAMGTGFTSLRLASPDVSDSTRRQVDDEVRELADRALRAALAIIDAHRPQLDEIAATLLAKEVIERVDIERIMGSVPGSRSARRGQGQLGLAAATAMDPAHPRSPRR